MIDHILSLKYSKLDSVGKKWLARPVLSGLNGTACCRTAITPIAQHSGEKQHSTEQWGKAITPTYSNCRPSQMSSLSSNPHCHITIACNPIL